jgi:hypothetical protein
LLKCVAAIHWESPIFAARRVTEHVMAAPRLTAASRISTDTHTQIAVDEEDPWVVVRNSPHPSSNSRLQSMAPLCLETLSSHSSWDLCKQNSSLPSSGSFGSRQAARLGDEAGRSSAQPQVVGSDDGRAEGVMSCGCSSGHAEPSFLPDDSPGLFGVSAANRIDWYPVGSMELDAVLAQELGITPPIGGGRARLPSVPEAAPIMSLSAFLDDDIPSFPFSQPNAPVVPSAVRRASMGTQF